MSLSFFFFHLFLSFPPVSVFCACAISLLPLPGTAGHCRAPSAVSRSSETRDRDSRAFCLDNKAFVAVSLHSFVSNLNETAVQITIAIHVYASFELMRRQRTLKLDEPTGELATNNLTRRFPTLPPLANDDDEVKSVAARSPRARIMMMIMIAVRFFFCHKRSTHA